MATLEQIDHIVVVLMENRSFDHMLGYLSHPDFGRRAEVNGQSKDPGWLARLTNQASGQSQQPFHTKRLDMSDDPKHERENFKIQFGADFTPGKPYPMTGFMQNYARNKGLSPNEYGQVMGFFTPAEIPITAFFADNYCICDNWFAPIPTSTQPNRLMAMGGYTKIDNTFSSTVPDQDLVYDWCARQTKRRVRWRVYHEGWPFFMVMNRWRLEILADAVGFGGHFAPLSDLADDIKHDMDLPELIFVEPKYTQDHFSPAAPSDDHAPSSASGGQDFLRRVYLALTGNPERWKRTVMILTYDEAGGLFDHQSPPELKTTVVESSADPFFTTGVRVPAIVISPLVKARSVYHGLLDHTSILKFIGQKFGDGGYYSNYVNDRPQVGSVLDLLGDPKCGLSQARSDIPQPPAYEPPDRMIRNGRYHPVTTSGEAFGYALKRINEDAHERERALTKFPDLAGFLTAHQDLLWELAQTTVKARNYRIGDCEANLRAFLDDQEKKLEADTSLAPVAYSNLSAMVNKMCAEARARGSFIISESDFLASKPASLFERG